MHASRFLIHTLKEAPADAEIISHQLMIRSGMIQRIAAGIYAFMPLGVRVMRKIEAIVRGEMNRAGALEALMQWCSPPDSGGYHSVWRGTGLSYCVLKTVMRVILCWGPRMKKSRRKSRARKSAVTGNCL